MRKEDSSKYRSKAKEKEGKLNKKTWKKDKEKSIRPHKSR